MNLVEVIVAAMFEFFGQISEDFTKGLKAGYRDLGAALFGTPTPETDGVFIVGKPTNSPWPGIHDALVGGEVMLVALALLLIAVQGRHTLRIFDIGSAYQDRKTRKTAWAGAVLIVGWYWIAALLLYLVEGFTLALLPSLTGLKGLLAGFVLASISHPVFGGLAVAAGSLFMWVFEGLLLLRNMFLYLYLYGMPIGIALAFANIPVISDIATGFAKKFVPLAVFPLPAVVMFRGLSFLHTEGVIGGGMSPIVKLLLSAAIPFVALWMTWKTFKYASPLTAKVIAKGTKGALWLGTVAGAAYAGGPMVGGTAARWGSKAAAGQALAHKIGHTETGGIPEYRRAENDPAYQ